ncbi:IclR family transcriptional regulator [Salinirubellus sp. GCM10025818]|uniref:IclR family transcriptional regulator n=1 Tax=Salinirubellus TaxID=2162630 RepID=UPI0030CD5C3B
MVDSNASSPRRIKAVQTSFRIVEELVECEEAGVTELADRLNLSKGTVHTHLSSLDNEGYVVKRGGRYRPSLRYLRIGDRIRESFDIYKHGRNPANRLAEECGELVYLAVKQGTLVCFLYAVRGSDNAIQTATQLGRTRYFHTTAAGKSMMAHMSETAVEEILNVHGLPRKTDFTVTDRHVLFEELEAIRSQGYAVNAQEQHLGAATVASSALRPNGEVIGTISISGPAAKFDAEYVDEMAGLVKEAANKIEIDVSNVA